MIETLDDIVERLANSLAIWGSHGEHGEHCSPERPCRSCWTADLKARIRAAVEVERKLNA